MEEKLQWNLNDIIKIVDFDQYYTETEKLLPEVDANFAQLSPKMSRETFRKIIDFEEKLNERLVRLAYLPELMESTNQKDSQAKLMRSRVDDLSLKFVAKMRKIDQWLKGKQVDDKKPLDEVNAKRLFKSIPVLTYSLNYNRLAAKYTLNLNEEDIISNKDVNGVAVLTDLRDLIETEFAYEFEPEGEAKRIIKNQAELMAYVYSPRRKERMAAYKAMLSLHQQNIDKFFAIYQAVVKDWDYETRLRGYKSPISMRNFANHIPDEAIETLLEVCRENTHIFQDYFKWKAKQLNLAKLKREDIYAPLPAEKAKTYTFAEAWQLVEETFTEFDPGFGDRAKKIVDDHHIDSHPNEAKRSGAFCATVSPQISPYVLLNFTGNLRDITTLAHELGHGIHSLYANKLPKSVQHANLPLAETASTTGEMVLFEKLYEKETNPQVKQAMMSDKIAGSYASIIRQCYFVIFEKMAHKAIAKGATKEKLGKMWLDTLREQFGDSVEVDDQFAYEWAYIPHIVQTPFYCYAYNFGELLSMALFAKYKKEGKSFVPKLEKILAAGGSRDPDEILKEVGVDMKSSEFWQGSFDLIAEWQKKL